MTEGGYIVETGGSERKGGRRSRKSTKNRGNGGGGDIG
jgi:hypothetical protein